MENKYCRICWNTNGWRKPSSPEPENGIYKISPQNTSKDSFVAQNGFGYEEWLFNYEWCIDGYKYAFLQPINKYRDKYEGQTFSAALYTKLHTKTNSHTLLVATVSAIYVPRLDELSLAFNQMEERGWVKQMRDDIEAIGGQTVSLENLTPHQVINVRFKPANVTIYDPRPVFPKNHTMSKRNRYHPFNWNGIDLPGVTRDNDTDIPDPTHSEEAYLRAAQHATQVDPKHKRLQNRLYCALCKQYGADAVQYEQDFVDLKVTSPDGDTFFEIKTDSSAKRCIRNAIGQLLEYSCYPAAERANRLVVVGDASASSDDIKYLGYLRLHYSIPIFYAQFDWEVGNVGTPLP